MTKDFAKSVKAKLLSLAQKNRLNYQVLLIRYLYERLLYRLSVSKYKDQFCLKGGALLYAYKKEFSRPTLDIDLLGIKIKNDETLINQIFIEIMAIPCEKDGVIFDTSSIKTEHIALNKAYHGLRLTYIARLDSIKQTMKIDIGFGDVIIPAAQSLSFPVLIQDLPVPDILAYSLETVVAEKFHAMIDLAESNSRYKDFYDVYQILSQYQLDTKTLNDAILATFRNRKTIIKREHPLFLEDFAINRNRNMQWQHFLKKINAPDIEFIHVMNTIVNRLHPVYHRIDI